MKFGIELEFTAAVLHAIGPQGGFYNYYSSLLEESGIHNWRVDQDASCGNEIVSPILIGEDGLKQALQACYCAELAKERFGLTRILGSDCGVHFHYDAENMSTKTIRNILGSTTAIEPLFYSMNPGARFDTQFAAPLNFNLFQIFRARDMKDIRNEWFRPYMGVQGHGDSHRNRNNNYKPEFINAEKKKPDKYDWTRYHGLNLVAYFKHGTIEFRYTHGSFDQRNVEMWFRIYYALVKGCEALKTRRIVKAFPFSHKQISEFSVAKIQKHLYSDLGKSIRFLFNVAKLNTEQLKFIIEKVIKYNHSALPKPIIREIWDYDKNESPEKLLEMICAQPVKSAHAGRRHYVY
jgi:hypothetical protein